jgi:dUTP pyrophosphatase
MLYEGQLSKQHPGDAGYDLHSTEECRIPPGVTRKVATGVKIALSRWWFASVRPRSGLSARGIHVSVGTIDSNYRGEISVVVFNSTNETITLQVGQRIAQLVFEVREVPPLIPGVVLPDTDRGEKGFGSTG